MKHPSHFFQKFLPFLIIITGIFSTTYGVVQQNYRQSANDPQIQIAEDRSVLLQQGVKPDAVTPGSTIDIAQSLGAFVIVFDKKGKPVTSSALLDDKTPTPPPGVFDYARQHGEDRLTWQPRSGVRIATVIKPYNNGYILVGRSLREVEEREQNLMVKIVIGYLVTVVTTAAAILIF